MSRKTKRVSRKKNTSKKHKKYTRRHLYIKRRQILSIPGSQGLPLFSKPVNKKSNRIVINNNTRVSGNMIPGLRNM